MEIRWKICGNFFIGFILIGLCSGFRIGLENSAADRDTQFLTGLIGVLLTICGIVFVAGCLCCQRKNGFKKFDNGPVVASSSTSLDHGHINPIANGEFTIFTPLSPNIHNNNVFFANERIAGQAEIDCSHAEIDVGSWFDGSEPDFPRTKLKYIKELGKGWFGRVVQGTAQGVDDKNELSWIPVAVRILEATATSSERAVFLHDAVIYRCGDHPHILQFLGRSLESVPLLLLQEFCPRGDLKKYLRDNQNASDNLLSGDLPLLWCCQLSSALKHLHDHKITHPDLATRNCQLVDDLSLKLGDYGLAASLYPEDYYQGAPAVPVRWCAPESLTYTPTTIQPKQTTFEGNIWSLGVTMWEIYECGQQPYNNFTDDEVISQVLGSSNVRLSPPACSVFYTDYIFRLMQMCWSTSESRPSASQVYLMLTDLMQVYQNTKHNITHSESPVSIQDFDKRWESFKPNSVSKTDNHEFKDESKSVDLSDISVLDMDISKETKTMSPSLNNLHGSLDNLTNTEMDSWLQKVASKTGDMQYVRGLSEAIKDLDNALALENVSSSDSSHQPSPAPENLPKLKNKLEFKLGPTTETSNSNTVNKINQCNSLTESIQRTSSESETEDENWRKKIERGAYSEKVHQKSKSVTDLMVLTHIDCSESDSETPLPSLDYRVNYKNVRYAPRQNLENVSLMFGSEGNLLSVHDKFQDELRRLQEERKDSLLFVPESISHNKKESNLNNFKTNSESSSDDETYTVKKDEDVCKYVNMKPTSSSTTEGLLNSSKNNSPVHRNPEALIEELSSPTEIQPGNQVYNIFNVTVNANYSPVHIKPNLKDIICYKDLEVEDSEVKVIMNNCNESQSPIRYHQVPKLADIIQNNDELMDYIITKYETPEDVTQAEQLQDQAKNLTREFLDNEKASCSESSSFIHLDFDVSPNQDPITNSAPYSSTPFVKRTKGNSAVHFDSSLGQESLQFSSNFVENSGDERSELKYSLETWDNFLDKAMDGPGQHNNTFDGFSSEPQSLLFIENEKEVVDCTNATLVKMHTHDLNCGLDNEDVKENVSDGANQAAPDETEMSPKDCETTVIINKTFNLSPDEQRDTDKSKLDSTFTVAVDQNKTITLATEEDGQEGGSSKWEPGEGWFLHPQSDSDVSGQMEALPNGSDSESYVGFSMDDEIMTAIRNELLMKLPQAQGQSSEQVKESDDWDTEERSEVLIKYNVYTTPLSPIPEESYTENDSYHLIYNRENSNDSSDSDNEDWPEPYEEEADRNSGLEGTETQSMQNIESPMQGQHHRHTPSQDSCCSNDTLFNLEELTCVISEGEGIKERNETDKKNCDRCDKEIEEQTNHNNNDTKEDKLIKNEGFEKTEITERINNVNSLENDNEDEVFKLEPIDLDDKSTSNLLVQEEHVKTSFEDLFAENLANTLVNDHLQNHRLNQPEALIQNDSNSEKVETCEESQQTQEISACNTSNEIGSESTTLEINEVVDCHENLPDIKSTPAVNGIDNSVNDERRNSLKKCKNNESDCNKLKENGKYDADVSLLNFKNIHNGLVSPKDPISRESDADLINDFEVDAELIGTASPVAKETDLNGKSSNFSLLVENNPNYITEFINHERQSSISSLGSSRDDDEFSQPNVSSEPNYVDVDDIHIKLVDTSEMPDYVNTNELLDLSESQHHEYVNVQNDKVEEHLYDPVAHDGADVDIYDALSDIRFTGPTDNQLMSTSFSESVDIDDQDWDSGSDTRSSSSGEFIWKEGEHEESVKALRAAPQDVIASEKTTPMEDIEELSEESSDDEDEADNPEFVPSAWDKYATPTKSALRSPEKTLERAEVKGKKSKGVWFKKQKYHCVYEYPREPESPNINYELWQPLPSAIMDWDVTSTSYVPTTIDGTNSRPDFSRNTRNLYQLPDFTQGMTALDDEFYISSTAKPFETFGGLSSQFFPGQSMSDQWMDLMRQTNDNVTPDSGVEDITPASNSDNGEFSQQQQSPQNQVQTLKLLAATALKNNQVNELKNKKGSLGGLRHARNKLKLDLPPSPSAFTSTKVFTIEQEEPIPKREVPTFTTFGKSRFLVQQVDTPTCDEENQRKNVSFEALPYKPIHIEKNKIESVRGEASLLDSADHSADEDSGIESSRLEKKKIENLE